MAVQRLQCILDLVGRTGSVSVEELVERFGVTPQTVRRDLNRLCRQHLLARTHGGARLASGVRNMSYEARCVLAAEQKAAIGRAAAALIRNDSSVFLGVGTTTEAVARALADHERLTVITNNVNIAVLMRPFVRTRVIIAAGTVRPDDGGVVGETATEFIAHFKLDYAVIGTSAIDADGALLASDLHDMEVAEAILSGGAHVVLVADSGKHGRRAPVRAGHASRIHSFVTDRVPGTAFRRMLEEASVRTIETG